MPVELQLITESGEQIGSVEIDDAFHERLHDFAEEHDLTFDEAFNTFVRIGMELDQRETHE